MGIAAAVMIGWAGLRACNRSACEAGKHTMGRWSIGKSMGAMPIEYRHCLWCGKTHMQSALLL